MILSEQSIVKKICDASIMPQHVEAKGMVYYNHKVTKVEIQKSDTLFINQFCKTNNFTQRIPV